MSSPDPFEEYRRKYGGTAAADPFEAYRSKYGAPLPADTATALPAGPKPGRFESLKNALRSAVSPRNHVDGIRMIDQVLTIGAGDEIRAALEHPIAAVQALVPGGRTGEAFQRAAAEKSAAVQDTRDRMGGAGVALEVATALPVAAMTGGGALLPSAARSLVPAAVRRGVPSVARAVGESAALAGTAGYNSADGGMLERSAAGGFGALFGGFGGATLRGATQPLSRPIVGGVSRAVAGATGGALLPADDVGERVRNAGAGAAALVAAPYAARRVRGDRVGAVGNVGSVTDPANPPAAAPKYDEGALGRLLNVLRGDRPHDDLALAAQSAREGTTPVSVLEMGDNTRGLARAARAVGGQAKQEIPAALNERGRGQADRYRQSFLELTGIGNRVDPTLALEDQAARRAQTGREMYGPLWEEFSQGIDDPRIAGLLDEIDAGIPGGSVRRQVDELVERMIRRGEAKPGDFRRRISRTNTQAINGIEDEVVEQVDAPTLRYLDLFKQSAQRRLNYARRDPELARSFDEKSEDLMKGALRDLVGALDERTGGEASKYRAARQAWGGDTEVMDYIQRGADFLNTPEREVAKLKGEGSSAAWDMYRQTALDNILEYIDGVAGRHDLTKRAGIDIDKPSVQRKLAMLFDDMDSFNAFRKRIADEVEMARSENFTSGNSQTVDKALEVARLFDMPIEDLATAGMNGGFWGTAVSAARHGVGRARAGYTSRAADNLVGPLTAGMDGNREGYANLLEVLAELEQKRMARESATGAGRRAGSAIIGVRTGDQFR